MVDLIKGCFENLHEAVRQISNEADGVEHECLLPIREPESPCRRVEGLKEEIVALEASACA